VGPGNLLVILHTLGFENRWVTAMGQGHNVMLAKMSSHPSQSLTLRVDLGYFISSIIFEMLIFKEPHSLHIFFPTLSVLCAGPDPTCRTCTWAVFDKCLFNSTEEHNAFLGVTQMSCFHTLPCPTHVLGIKVH